MRTFLKVIILGFVLQLLFSCTERRFQYLGYTYWGGYDPKIDYGEWGRSPNEFVLKRSVGDKTDYGRDWQYEGSSIMGYQHFYGLGGNTHGHYLLRDYRYAVFCPEGYVSECDIEKLKDLMHKVTRRCLLRMLAAMDKNVFVYDRFNKMYMPYLSASVKKEIESVVSNNPYRDLGGWQILKPTKGVDNETTFYKVKYKNGGWFDIFCQGETDTVSIKVEYSGKHLNPVIVGVRNRKMNIDICDVGYKPKNTNKMLGYTLDDDDYMFFEYLCPIIYKETGRRSLVTEADFDRLATKVNERRMAFVRQFYKNLLSSDNNLKKLHKSYFYSLPQRLVAMADSQIAKKDNRADMFLPCSYREFAQDGYDVTYLGKDWYQVTAPKSSGNSLKLKVVLYGPWVCPAIMGIKNPIRNVDYCPQRFSEE